MKYVLLIALVAASTAVADSRNPPQGISLPRGCRDRGCVRGRDLSSGETLAFFEFAPASGAGMTAPCACTSPTGAKGEVLTFTRASSGTCLKGNTTTNIANGDLVTCAVNEPRVMPGGDGSGGLGLLVEGVRTNRALRSEEFDNAAWVKGNSGSSAPTVTANFAVAPDGTTTAERVQFPATTAAERTFVTQNGGGLIPGAASGSIFLKGTASSGTIPFALWNGASYTCVTCSFTSATWTRCKNENVAGGASATWLIGNIGDAATCNDGAHSAVDLLMWGAGWEVGTFISSYIKTEGAAVTRADELADLPVTFGAGTAGVSVAATLVTPVALSALGTNPTIVPVVGDLAPGNASGSPSYLYTFRSAGGFFANDFAVPTSNQYTSATSIAALTGGRFVSYHDGTTQSGCVNGTCLAGTAFAWRVPTWTRIRIGTYSAAQGYTFGVFKQVCLDPSPTRCR